VSKRPAPRSAFKPGQSGNPAGRKKLPEDIKALAKAFAPEAFGIIIEIARDPDHAQRFQAAKEACDRAWGKATQAIDMQGDLRVEVRGMSDEELDARIAALVASQGP
jgi:hypothetical protein